MQFNSLSLLRVALLAAVVSLTLPAYAADNAVTVTNQAAFTAGPSDTVDKTLNIGSAVVRLKLAGGTAFVAVTKGEVNLTYADGSALTTVVEGTGLKIEGFVLPGSGVVASMAGGKATLSLAAAASLTLQSNAKGAQLKLMHGGAAPEVLDAGETARVNAPAVSFSAGQSVSLKVNQVGKATAGVNELLAIGTATGLAVTTQNATASIKGAGSDELVLSKGAVLSINNGALAVSATAVSLTGAKVQLVSTSGNIQIMRGGKATPFPTGRTIGEPAPIPTQPMTTPPVATLPPPPPAAAAATSTTVTTAAEDQKILDEMDAWNAGK